MGRDRHMELVPSRAPGHQRHRVAGRAAHAAAGRAGEVPHAYNVPGRAALHQPGAARPRHGSLFAGSGRTVSSRA